MAERRYSLCVCRFPGQNQEHPASSGWVIEHMRKWLADPRISRVFHLRRSDTPITMVRNLLVQKALEEKADYILMIDSDMQPDCEPDGKPFWDSSWDFMMERRETEGAFREALRTNKDAQKEYPTEEAIEREVWRFRAPATIAAPYCGPPPVESVYVMHWTHGESGTSSDPMPYALEMFDRDHAATFTGIFEVAALATGLILYDARLFKRLPPPWFDYEWADPPFNTRKASTEDIFQTRNASLIGMPQFCNWDAWAAHIKPKAVRKPRGLAVSSVPDAMADAIRTGRRGDHQIQILNSPEDLPARPTVVPVAAKPDA